MSTMIESISSPTIPADVIIEKEEYAYGFIMEVLTRGLYPDKLHVIREYVQNAYDAILDFRRTQSTQEDTRIVVKISPPSIFIFDNGIGMGADRIAEYRYVGFSRKLTADSVGFRGIGKLSGISAAEKIIITTSPLGSPEKFKLEFDAEAMLNKVEQLKESGENIALNELITDYTELTVDEDEEVSAHYTQVELYNIRPDSEVLLDEEKIKEYLGFTAPVDFAPEFSHGEDIDRELREYVPDYDTVPLTVNDTPIFKPYLENGKSPQNIFVWPDDGDGERGEDHIAYCWYCEHRGKGQYQDRLRRGLHYKVKNFTVGTNQHPRITLWKNTPERAFYFFGEIHVCDPAIVPSADRTDFEQNEAREQLYEHGINDISRTLNRIAGKSSDRRRAIEFVEVAETIVESVGQDVEQGKIPTEVRVPKIVELSNAIENVEKRKKNAPPRYKKRGGAAVEEAQKLIKVLGGSETKPSKKSATYNIQDEMQLNKQARWVYQNVVEVLKIMFGTKPDIFEKIVTEIHNRLRGEGN